MRKASVRVAIGFVVALSMLATAPPSAGDPAAQEPPELVDELREAMADHHGIAAPDAAVAAPEGAGYQAAAGAKARSRRLKLLGSNDLGGGGFNSDVWIHRRHSYTGTWGLWTPDGVLCPNDGTKVVNIKNPRNPVLVNLLPAPVGTQTNDTKVARVRTPYFKGDLLVVSNEDCRPGGARGFELWDVTDPANATFLSRFGPEVAFDEPPFLQEIGFGVHNTFIFKRYDRVYVAAVVDFAEIFQLDIDGSATVGDLRIVDVTDPRNPVQVADWGAIKDLGLDPFETGQGDDFALSFLHDVWVERGIAYLSWWDAGLILLDVSDPTNPQFISRTPYAPDEEGNAHVAVPARGGKLVITGDEDFTPFPWGFGRVFNSRDVTNPFQIATFATENTLNAPPPEGDFSIHNVITRYRKVYASWYSDGLRVWSIKRPSRPREIAFFVPPAAADPFGVLPTAPEVWGVHLKGKVIAISDMNSGLWLLKEKGKKRY